MSTMRDFLKDFTLVVAPALIASLLTAFPLENFLSAYLVPPAFVWYVPWRGAIVSIILWLLSGAFYSDKRYWLKEVFLGSAVSFITFHYWFLYILSLRTRVSLIPLAYTVGNSPPTLDLGQLVALLTLAAFRKEILSVVASLKQKAT
ncbi:hypothetical protein IG193_02925 [Infirmifilum lucidum]|uniref:Uncharacterized protein n=1 Tax=Infirmifilum lucidum TaxID=2776706 RepID=A0A7L9FI15_9CREN|nr:hypothetical protein [Infirmifilum lucidum]QOJ79430.1 hypothetical protein IG193_02925 [Infirmifilum lucidum]